MASGVVRRLRILVVTGKLAAEAVARKVEGTAHDVEVFPISVSVAAFITPEVAVEALGDIKGEYDLILLPGTVRGDVSPVEEATGMPTFKGPSNTNDIPLLLQMMERIELSKTESASTFLMEARRETALKEIAEAEENWRSILEEYGGMIVGDAGRELPIGVAFPMRVIAEIVNAPTLKIDEAAKRARYFEAEGADIIDIGMLASVSSPDDASALVETVKASVGTPVSIDSLDPSEIRAAVDAGVDLVLSVDRGNMAEVAPHVSDIPVVVLPSDMSEGVMPHRAEERIRFLQENIRRARELGIGKIIADPVLEPAVQPGLLESLKAYGLFRELDGETPVLFGLGNVTELIDVDSPGVNGLLAALADEVRANLLFIPEHSAKAKGSVRETVLAAKMMYLARRREAPPKDLGIDLLVLKEKRRREVNYDPDIEVDARIVEAEPEEDPGMDDLGWFMIQVDRGESRIVAAHFKETEEPSTIIKGKTAREVYQTIIREGLIGKFDHAAYLGKELTKAELALRLGRSYVQDEPLFY